MSAKEDNGAKESKESDYEKDNDQLEVEYSSRSSNNNKSGLLI